MSEEKKEKKKASSVDPCAMDLLAYAEQCGIETAFSRSDAVKPCPIGAEGACCKICSMGPCRLKSKEGEDALKGVCGAGLPTVTARNIARMVAGGTAAHSDHARDVANTLLAAAEGHAADYQIKDVEKLQSVAKKFGIDTSGKNKNEVAKEVAEFVLRDFGQQKGEVSYIRTATKKRQALWRELGLVPRGVDREITELMHRTTMGVDTDPEDILNAALRVSLADGWSGSMIGTDFSDIMFGTPKPIKSEDTLGAFRKEYVNVVVHGHEPTLSEMIVVASEEPDMISYAKSKGAAGINLVGMCCTSNEILVRHGIKSAGGFLNQELGILTGAVEAMVVDVQCIMPALGDITKKFHTKLVTTSPKGRIPGATHIEFDEHRALQVARDILKLASDNFANRPAETRIPNDHKTMVAGFSHEYIQYMQGGRYRGSFRPLNDAIISGRIRGLAGVVGCNNPRVEQDSLHNYLVRELIANDVLVVQTGCGAHAAGKAGLMVPETMDMAGPGLREVCEAIGIPPVLHMGSCVDNSRILTVLTAVAQEGGLGDDISDIPVVGIAPEWMSEKALAIAFYAVASGLYVIFGVESPIAASPTIQKIMSEGWEKMLGGKMEFIVDKEKILEATLAHIDKKRDALKLRKYEKGKFGVEKVLMDMADRRKLEASAQAHKGVGGM
ncbi:MAG: anaerobic carbon-monoxide dehydrogenase catalytic subunit [Nitrospirota bacterium]